MTGAVRKAYLFVAAMMLLPTAWPAEAADLGGVVFTAGSDRVKTVWPNARVSLKNPRTGSETSTTTDHLGEYAFTGVEAGAYEVQVALAGFETLTRPVTLEEEKRTPLDLELRPARRSETLEVTAEVRGVDTVSSSGGAPALSAELLRSAVRLSEDFQEALPLLPGVVRGPDGLLRIKGGRANQANTLVNTASVVDPFTGQPALRLPAVAVESVRVLSSPFSAEYGGFASGIVEVNTRGGTDRWRWLFEDPIPRLRWINRRIHGIDSASPHLVFAGPVKKEKLYLFQSTSYRYDIFRVRSLPDPRNVRVEKGFNSHTQVDWVVGPSQRFTSVLTVDPGETDFGNIGTFNPEPVTGNYRQRGFFAAGTHRWVLPAGGFVQSAFSAKRLDARIFPADVRAGAMALFPERNSGTFFDRQDRRTRMYQLSQSLHWRPFSGRGRHLVSAGYAYARSNYRGTVARLPVQVLRGDRTRSREITYGAPAGSEAVKDELSFFVQDNWQVLPRVILDLGLRLQRDSLSAEAINPAPRIGFVFAPSADERTAIRGGFGMFYDKIPINVAVFPDLPRATVARFAADGSTPVQRPVEYAHVVATGDGRLRVPYSLGWTLQFDRQVRDRVLFRFGYEQRKVYRDFYLAPAETGGAAELRLFNSGRQSYREFLWMVRWQPVARTTMYTSYVHARAYGESNDYNQYFGDFSYPLIRPNQRVRLSHDVPHRLLSWGMVGLPRKLELLPVLDLHSGFPFSKLDTDWDFIGRKNEAGRFPVFVGLDVKVQYPFDFRFRRWRFKFRAGVKVFNVLNHFNPRDVQQYAASDAFGVFYNSVGRLYRLEGEFDF